MPDLNQQVYAVLSADPALSALVDGRIWNTKRPQEEIRPALTFQRISTISVGHAQGTDELAGVRYQLDAYADDLNMASDIVFRARDALEVGFNAVQITRRDIYDDDGRCFHVSLDCSVWGQDYM